ncbi:MAG: hypothetical protein ABGZ17_11095, partial [Planctomycetaceae bacterium]
MWCLIRSSVWVVAGILLISPAAACGQANRKLAITDPGKADADFLVQGEYVGSHVAEQTAHANCWRSAALQVLALGDGQFEVVRYNGGLPGDGWDGAAVQRLKAKRDSDGLQLQDETQLSINGDCVTVRANSGRDQGHYQKIHR